MRLALHPTSRRSFAVIAPLMSTFAAAVVPPARYTPNIDLTDAGYVTAIERLPDGRLIIAATMTRVSGVAHGRVARLDTDGNLDSAWNPAPNNGASALFVDAAGRLYVGGFFTTIAGQPRTRLARFDASGALDAGFAPSIEGGGVNAIGAGLSGEICFGGGFTTVNGVARNRLACVDDTDGSLNMTWDPGANNTVVTMRNAGTKLYVGGYFTTAGGMTRNRAARLALSGSGAADTWNPNINDTVLRILPGAAGEVYAAGFFSAVGGTTRPGVAKVNDTTGALITAWNAQCAAPCSMLDVALDISGNVFAIGDFTSLGGQPRRSIARLSSTTGNAFSLWNPGIQYGYGTELLAIPDGDVVFGGPFSSAGGGEHVALARVEAGGTIDPTFNPRIETAGQVFVLARNPVDGSTIVGGRFVRADGFIRRNLLKLVPPGRVDPNWSPDTDSEVRALQVDAVGRVYVGGFFGYVDGTDRPFVARLLNTSDGSVDTNWNPAPNNYVYNLLLRNEGLYVSGVFGTVGGTSRSRLARVSVGVNGTLDAGWTPAPDGSVVQMVSAPDNSLIVSGGFGMIGGASRAGLAKLSTGATAVADAAWTPDVTGSASSLAIDGTDLYVGGEFTAIDGQPRTRLARLSASGSGALNAAWTPTLSEPPQRIRTSAAGVYVAGTFTQVNGVNRAYLARLDKATGATDTDWQANPNNWVMDLFPFHGSVFAGGMFSSIGGQARVAIARIPEAADTIYVDDFDG